MSYPDVVIVSGARTPIGRFQGALSSRATIAEMTIADDEGVWLTLRGAVLDWNRAALLRRQVSINELSAEEVIISRPPVPEEDAIPSAEAPGFALPELPVSVTIRALRADRVELGEPLIGEEAVFSVTGNLALSGGDGEAALEIINEQVDGIDLVISDVVMPNMDGPTLIKLVRQKRPDLKVIFISGYAGDSFRKRLDAHEDIHFLQKPFSLKQLAGKMKDVRETSAVA